MFFTTVFKGDEFEPRRRRRPKAKTPQSRLMRDAFGRWARRTFRMPSLAAAYNDEMDAVDTADQLRASHRYLHRICRGGWQVIAWTFLLETVITNSFLLQGKKLGSKASWEPFEPQLKWREHLVDVIFEAYGKTYVSRKRYRTGDIFTPISQHIRISRGVQGPCVGYQGFHFDQIRSRSKKRVKLGEITGNKNTKNEVVIPAPKVKRTWSGCKQCNVAICTSDRCWYNYHTPI